MLRSIGTMTVIGISTIVSSTLISCASTYCTANKLVIVSTIGLIRLVVVIASLLLFPGYDCGNGAAVGGPLA